MATVCSDEFAPLGQSEAEALGLPSLPIVAVPHPLGSLAEARIREIADDVMDEIIFALTQPKDRLAEGYTGKYLRMKRRVRYKQLFA